MKIEIHKGSPNKNGLPYYVKYIYDKDGNFISVEWDEYQKFEIIHTDGYNTKIKKPICCEEYIDNRNIYCNSCLCKVCKKILAHERGYCNDCRPVQAHERYDRPQ